MADRLVQVSIRAEVSNFLAGAAKVQAATEKTATAAQKLEKQHAAFEKVGTGITTIGVAAAAAVAIAVKSFADFDAQMSQVQSLSHATAAEMDTLRNAALTMGQSIGFSATEVAQAETELVKAGVGVKDIMGGALKGALDLAAAGQIDVANATEIAATAMTQFGLKGKDIPHVADLLAAAADKSLGGVDELGQALKQSGLVAAQFGLSIDDTVGTLAEFASAGLMGSDAGTSLKQMFLQLATPTKQAQDAMEKYHISAYNAQGDFVGITALAGQLEDGFRGVDKASRDSALGIIFGSDAIRAANILMTEGADDTAKWISSVNDAGFAAAQAAGKTDNLNGDIKKLGAAFESGLIKSGSASNDVLRTMVQNATGLVKAVSSLPEPVQGVGLGLTALVAATALAGGGFLQLVPKIAAARTAMKDLNITRGALARGFGSGAIIAVGIAAIASGVANLGSEAQLTEGQLKKLNAAMTSTKASSLDAQFVGGSAIGFDPISKKVTSAREALKALNDDAANINASKFVDGLTFGLLKTSDTAKRFEAQFKQMGTVLSTTAETDFTSATNGFNQLVKQMGGGQETARQLLDRMSPYKEELSALASAAGKTASEQDLLNLAQGKGKLAAQLAAESAQGQKEQLAELSGVASQADDEIGQLADTIRSFGSTQLSVEQTESDFQQAIDDATAALKENGVQFDKTSEAIDLNSDKGRANAAALRQIAQDGVAATAAIAENGGTQEEAASKMQNVRDAYIKAAESFGYSKDQAVELADGLKLIPANVSTLFEADTSTANSKTDELTRKLGRVPTKKETKLYGEISDARSKIDELQKKLASVPASKRTAVQAEIAAARANLNTIQSQLNAIQSKSVTVTVNRNVATNVTGGNVAFATGGHVRGPGTETSDSIPALLSDNEYVIKASSVRKYGTGMLDRINAGRYANGGLVARFASGGSAAAAAAAAQKRAEARQKAEADALQKLADVYSFRTGVRSGSLTGSQAVSQALSIATDQKYPASFRRSVGRIAGRSEQALLSLEKRSDKAAAAVDKASSKLDGLKSSASSMSSAIQSKLGDVPFGDYRSASSLQSGLARRATRLKEFQGLLTTLRKKGIVPALLNEVASLGIDQGLPLARSLAAASTTQIKDINAQYNSVQSTSTKIGNQVADANFGKLISTAERQLKTANANATKITNAINAESRKLQRIIGRALGVPGYAVGGYTGNVPIDQVAGVVHGREYVVNAAATARNRATLEAMNRGERVQYMDPTPMLRAAANDQRPFVQENHFPVMPDVDPNTVVEVVGRQTARAFAGMVR